MALIFLMLISGVPDLCSALRRGLLIGLQRLVAIALSFVFCLGFNIDVQAATFVVNSTGDASDAAPGNGACSTGGTNSQGASECTLRAALEEANAFTGADTVNFNMPVTEPGYSAAPLSYTTQPALALPTVSTVVVINGSTQPDFPGTPIVVLDGVSAGGGVHGLLFANGSDGSTVRNLQVNRFSANGIEIQAGADGITIAGNWIGSDGSGASAPGNGNNGINMQGGSGTIGGTGAGDRNVINNNGNEGINLTGGGATANQILGNHIGLEYDGSSGSGNGDVGIAILTGASGNTIGGLIAAARNVISMNFEGMEINSANNTVTGNYIGTDAGGTLDRGNRSDDGIEIQAGGNDNTIGGTAASAANLIAFNQLHGVNVVTGTGNRILSNSIHSNDLLGINLGSSGVTANDVDDLDSGPNELLNFPVITSVTHSGSTLTVDFEMEIPPGDYRVEFFTNPVGADPSGNGEGQIYADTITVSDGGGGSQNFSHSFPGSVGDIITATTTQEFVGPTYGSTSEFSAAFTATAVGPFSARWPLDETVGVTAADIDAGNDGSYQNGVALNQTAACLNTGNAVHFDGIDDYVEVPHSPDYLMGEGTVSLWANVDGLTALQQALFSKDSNDFDTGGHLTITVEPTGEVQTRLQSTSTSTFVTTVTQITPGTWFHVAFSWGPAGMALYFNGAAPITDPYTGGLGVTSGGPGNFEPITFGTSQMNSDDLIATPVNRFLKGFIDDVRIYNRALTQPEIITLAGCAGSLDIVKRAFWPDGTAIPTGATIPSGVAFKYLLYVNNPGGLRADVTVLDVLDPAFQYQAGTIQVDNSLGECAAAVCTAVEEQAIFAAASGAVVLTDAIDGDAASYTGVGTTIDAGNGNVGNLQLDINGSAVWAILFSAKMP